MGERMSVSRSGGSGGSRYSDHEWLQITFDSSIGSGPADNDDSTATHETVDVHSTLNLDNNELAELTYFSRMGSLKAILNDDVTATAVGSIELSGNLEINSGVAEWALSDQIDTPTSARNRPNYIDSLEAQLTEFVKDSTNQVGGGGYPCVVETRDMSYLDAGFESGPALDANDDLDFRFEFNRDTFVHGANIKFVYNMAFRTHRIQGTRNEFAIPSGD